jgi:hypothetical protein
MNTENLLVETLEEAASQVTMRPLSVPVDAGRRRRYVPAATAGGLLALVACALVLSNLISTVDVHPDRVTPPLASNNSPGLYGLGDAALPLPAGWTFNDTSCGVPQSSTLVIAVYRAEFACQVPRPEGVSDIVLMDIDNPEAGPYLAMATQPFTLSNGSSALIGSADAPEAGYTVTVVVASNLESVAVGTSPVGTDLSADLRALTSVPDGQVAVPLLVGLRLDEVNRILSDLGLSVIVEDGRPDEDSAVVDESTPSAGSVVDVDSSVTVGTTVTSD